MAWYNSAKDLGNSIVKNKSIVDKTIGKTLAGGSKDAGALGVGQYKTGPTQINEGAFTSTAASDARRGELAKALGQFNGRAAPTMSAAQINTAQANQSRDIQSGLAGNLQARVNGTGGPSLAAQQQQQGLNQALANTLAQAASTRGVNPALALRMSQQNNTAAQQNATTQGGILRAQEQQAAENQLAGLSGTMRTQDMDLAGAQAQLNQQANANNQQATLANRGLNDAQVAAIRSQQLGLDEADRQAAMDLGKLRVNEGVGVGNINNQAYSDASGRRANALGGIAGGLAQMFSDKNLKTDIKPAHLSTDINMPNFALPQTKKGGAGLGSALSSLMGGTGGMGGGGLGSAAAGAAGIFSDENSKEGITEASAKDFIGKLKAYNYDYKNPEHGEGRQLGVMAQDLEKSKEGKKMVENTPEGKMVDFGKGGGIIVATQAMLNERLNGLEKALKSKLKGAA